jgi:hypothetical protein
VTTEARAAIATSDTAMRPMDVFVIQFFILFYFLLEFVNHQGLKPPTFVVAFRRG